MGSSSSSSSRQHNPFECSSLSKKQRSLSTTSASSQSEIHLTRSKIRQMHAGKLITEVEIYQSPLDNPLLRLSNSSSASLMHWQLIVKINDTLFWLISFGADGQENSIHWDKNVLIEKRKENKKQRTITIKPNILVENILSIIQEVKHRTYNVGQWNCQLFVDHIVQKIQR